MIPAIHHMYVLSALCTILICNVNCEESPENQVSNVTEFHLWFVNETALSVLWKPCTTNDVVQYIVYIEPPDSVDNILFIQSRGEVNTLMFSKLVPGKSYTIFENTSNTVTSSHLSSAVYQTIPLNPSNVSVDNYTLTTDSFRITWEPPVDPCEFEKYQVKVNSSMNARKIFSKQEIREYVVNENVLPGRTYKVDVITISGAFESKPNSIIVTLKPLPVQNVTIIQNSKLVWNIDPDSEQDSFLIKIADTELSKIEKIALDLKELSLELLPPGRKYNISIKAVSHDVKSEATSIEHIVLPLTPVLKYVKPVEDGLEVAWKSDVQYGQDMFQVVYHRSDVEEVKSLTSNNTHIILNHLHPGALYAIQVFSMSKYGNSSASTLLHQAVMPIPPGNVTASYVNTTTLSVSWDSPQNSLITGYLVRYRTEDRTAWKKITSESNETSQKIMDLSAGERYKIQVSFFSHDVESTPVELVWTTPPAPVPHVVALLSATTITLKFPHPPGHVDFYNVTWTSNVTETKNKLFPNNATNTEHFVLLPVEDLSPGVSYRFILTSVSYYNNYYTESSVTTVLARTWPVMNSEPPELVIWDTVSGITIRYNLPETVDFDFFRFNLSAKNESTRTIDKRAKDTDTLVAFDSVVLGKLYNVQVYTVSDNLLSVPTQLQHRVHPVTVREVNATSVSNNSITLAWKVPQGEYSKFEIIYHNVSRSKIVVETSASSVIISKLQPYHNYTFQIKTLAGLGSLQPCVSSTVVLQVQTLESQPGKVNDFHPVLVHAQNITFVWTLPAEEHHGVITQFTLHCILGEWTKVIDIPPQQRNYTVTNLKPGRRYLFLIQARTKVDYGPMSEWRQVMPVLAPPQPAEQLVPTPVEETTSTIQIRFCKSFFSNENGDILYYTIIVSEDPHDNITSKSLTMPGWNDVQALQLWPPYQVTLPYQLFTNISTIAEFTVGNETCVAGIKYCNGPLKSGATYKIKVRAFTREDLFTDTAYSNPMHTKQNYTFIIYWGAGLTVIFLLVVGVFMQRRLCCTEPRDVPLDKRSHPILVSHFQTLDIDNDPIWIYDEFDDLRLIGRGQTSIAAELPCNRPKNRFSNILPYDHSRYKLQPVDDEDGSDYVNANYISGHLSPRQYIATQGPLCTTQDEFWRMCWESRTPAIVMLTQCVEKGREKCYRYWPIGERVLRCGDMDIRLLQVCHYSGWSISRLKLSRAGGSRVIYHFHFTTWPDSGVPQSSEALVRFVLSFRSRVSSEQGPIIVHCSAGVGRTGTFIAVDTIYQSLQKSSSSVDILGIIYQLRKQRMCMVQTVEQYLYIYLCVKLLLQAGAMTTYSESEDSVFSNDAFDLDEGVDDL